jgi:dihydroorotate dehydrogenase (fumarate)
MTDLSTKYMGLTLKNPIMVASSRLTRDIEGLKTAEDAGAGAVVLTSIFEEEIRSEVDDLVTASSSPFWHSEAMHYITRYGKENAVGRYLDFINEAKSKLSIPVFASVHCTSAEGWTDFAERVEAAGADALELNLHVLPSNPELRNRQYESVYYDVLSEVRKRVSLPIALKLGFFFSGLARTYRNLSRKGVDALVLFNRYYGLDFDIEELSLKSSGFLFRTADLSLRLRWVSIMVNHVECDIAASGGIYEGEGVIKLILAGASAVEVCSALYKNGMGHLNVMLDDVREWMDRQGFDTIEDFRGKLSQAESENPAAYERVQFLKGTECDC